MALRLALGLGALLVAAAPGAASPSSAAPAWHVYVVSVATGTTTALAAGADPAVSPSGKQVAYIDDGQLWVMAADGSDQRQLTQLGAGPPTWSPDGSRLVYTKWNVDPCYPGPATKCAITEIWTVNADGTGERKLLPLALSPAWSPDGRRLLYRDFAGPAEAGMASGVLELARADGTHIASIPTSITWDGTRQVAAWSPNGRWIAYERQMWSGEHRLLVIRPDGAGRRRVSSGSSPTWSPDGKLLAYERKNGVFVVPFAGGTPRRLAPSGSCPTWSPKGKRLAFVTANYPATNGTLSIVDRDGRHRRNLAPAEPCFIPEENDFPAPPSWSPDGRNLYYGAFAG